MIEHMVPFRCFSPPHSRKLDKLPSPLCQFRTPRQTRHTSRPRPKNGAGSARAPPRAMASKEEDVQMMPLGHQDLDGDGIGNSKCLIGPIASAWSRCHLGWVSGSERGSSLTSACQWLDCDSSDSQ